MPKYFTFKICGYYLYFTTSCIDEPIHIHISDTKLSEKGSAKLWLHCDGTTTIQNSGTISDRDMNMIRKFIHKNINTIENKWKEHSNNTNYKNK